MKRRSFLLFCELFLCINIFSQIDHNFFIGGNLSGALDITTVNRVESENNSSYSTGFFGGYYFKRTAIGLGLDISQLSNDYTDQLILSKSYLALYFYPYLRYYFKRGLFIHAQFNIGYSDLITKYNTQMIPKYTTSEVSSPYFIAGYTICIGYSFKFKERLLIEPMMKSVFLHNFASFNGDPDYNRGFGYYFCLDFIYAFRK